MSHWPIPNSCGIRVYHIRIDPVHYRKDNRDWNSYKNPALHGDTQ